MCCEHESKAFLLNWLYRCSAAVSEGIRRCFRARWICLSFHSIWFKRWTRRMVGSERVYPLLLIRMRMLLLFHLLHLMQMRLYLRLKLHPLLLLIWGLCSLWPCSMILPFIFFGNSLPYPYPGNSLFASEVLPHLDSLARLKAIHKVWVWFVVQHLILD